MRSTLLVCISIFCATSRLASAQSFDTQGRDAWAKLQTAAKDGEALMIEGQLEKANAQLLAVFPENERTAAQSFLLGNLLFEIDRKVSYALHQAAAKAEPENLDVLWEWALQQHRAGQYEAALESYKKCSKAQSSSAATYALQADCLLRLNRVDEAIDAWLLSEKARGSIEAMESIVCAVHRDPAPYATRADLLSKATTNKDIGAAEELIALDCAFPSDWWNIGPHEKYLDHDLPAVVKALNLPADDLHIRSMQCAVECVQTGYDEAEAIRRILSKYKLLTDSDLTIPSHPGLFELIMNIGIKSDAIEKPMLDKLRPKLKDYTSKSKDPSAWLGASAVCDPKDPNGTTQFLRDAWKATGDFRFAAGILTMKEAEGTLTSNDEDLLAALKEFPESGTIHRFSITIATREDKLTRELLVAAAKAEFHRFSSFVAPFTAINRPRADYLRSYMLKLEDMRAKAKTEKK